MRIIARPALIDFWTKYPDAEQPLRSWYHEALNASWKNPADVKRMYASASILKNSRVVFNIGGNKYRLVVKIEYRLGHVYIRFIGTHRAYDTIDADTV